MTEKIPQHVILDLLPLYFEGEVNEDTRVLIEQYLQANPQLARLAEQAQSAAALQEIPAALGKETEMQALKQAKKLMIQHNLFLILAVILTLMAGISSIFLWDEPRGPQAPYIFGGLAAVFWFAFFLVNRRISD